MKEKQQPSNLFDRYVSWHSKLTLPQKIALAYTTLGVSEFIPNAKTILLSKAGLVVGGSVASVVIVGTVGVGVNLIPSVCNSNPTCPFKSAPEVVVPSYTRWNNPNVKPFEQSPFFSGGFNETVRWDANTKQWYCNVSKDSATPCKDAEGKTADQLTEQSVKAKAYMANRDAQQDALNDYWCGPLENAKKTGCNSL